jgi:hypothetical protein
MGAPSSHPGSAQSRRLRFDTRDDALDFSKKSVEDSQRWLAAHHINLAQGYAKGDFELALDLAFPAYGAEVQLLFFSVPPITDSCGAGPCPDRSGDNLETFDISLYRKDHLVFVGAGHSAQCPKQVITSKIRLKRTEVVCEDCGDRRRIYCVVRRKRRVGPGKGSCFDD